MTPEEMLAAATQAEIEAAELERKASQQVTEFMNNTNFQLGVLRERARIYRELAATLKTDDKLPELTVLPGKDAKLNEGGVLPP